MSQSLGSVLSVDLSTGEKEVILDSCFTTFNEQALSPENWGLQNLHFDTEHRNLYIVTGNTVLKFNVDNRNCTAPRAGFYSSFFDVVVTKQEQIIGSYFNTLNQFDLETEESVIISK